MGVLFFNKGMVWRCMLVFIKVWLVLLCFKKGMSDVVIFISMLEFKFIKVILFFLFKIILFFMRVLIKLFKILSFLLMGVFVGVMMWLSF